MEDLPEPLLPMSSTFFFLLRVSILAFVVELAPKVIREVSCADLVEAFAAAFSPFELTIYFGKLRRPFI